MAQLGADRMTVQFVKFLDTKYNAISKKLIRLQVFSFKVLDIFVTVFVITTLYI